MIGLAVLVLAAAGCARQATPPAERGSPRIISLAPSLTEMICALGAADQLAGRTDVCNYPPEQVARVPIVGSFGRPTLERLLALRPTLVLEVDLDDKSLDATFARLGIAHRRVRCETLDDIPAALREVGALTHCAEKAEQLAAELEGQIATWRAASAAIPDAARPAVFVEIWSDPVTTVGRGSFVSEMVTLAGGRNIGDATGAPYAAVSSEWVLQSDPQLMLCLYMSQAHSARAAVMRRAGWDVITAVRAGRVHDELDRDLLLRPGPRVAQAMAQLRAVITPGERE